jgi:arylsulfatase A-like enzyme
MSQAFGMVVLLIVMTVGMATSCSRSRVSLRPNILWICVDDAKANMGVYGEAQVRTPNIDRLASEGVMFTSAFMTAAVCSPSRSALMTGMYQTSIGAHHHRSSRARANGVDIPNHHAVRLPSHVRTAPAMFREAGYFVTNGDIDGKPGKTDYNFEHNLKEMYDGSDWAKRAPGQPFFAQVQLLGGKNRGAPAARPIDRTTLRLPPYYPDHPTVREEYGAYLDTIPLLDAEVGRIIDRLRSEGALDNTAIFFFTDNGNRMIRDKQFLYDGGIHTPLIVRYPRDLTPDARRDELVSGIDIPATSLYLAGIPIPAYMEGRTMFGPDYKPRSYIAAARDRCDYTQDKIRAIRTRRHKYIRNYMTDRPYTQPMYLDEQPWMKAMKQLYAEGKMTPGQAWFWARERPAEELYDLQADPHEMNNLAADRSQAGTLEEMRGLLRTWIEETGDQGQQPEHPDSLRDVRLRWPKQSRLIQ